MHKLRSFLLSALAVLLIAALLFLMMWPRFGGKNCTYSCAPISALDLNKSGRITAENFADKKREYLNYPMQKKRNEDYQKQPLTEPIIAKLEAPMPPSGKVRVLIFAVSFPDYSFAEDIEDPAQGVLDRLFGREGPFLSCYPMENLTAYYERASYGRLHIEADAFNYRATLPVKEYAQDVEKLYEELMEAFDDQIDYRDYDADHDGVLDGIVAVVPEEVRDRDDNHNSHKDWWPTVVTYFGDYQADGVRIGRYSYAGLTFHTAALFDSQLIHEFGHFLGLPDYYRYNVEPDDPNQTIYALNGDAGKETMDDSQGDYSAASKLMLGWITENEMQVYTGGTQTFRLYSVQRRPSCIVIPRESSSGLDSEFFVLEYLLPESNNAPLDIPTKKKTSFFNGGIRVMHCDAHVSQGELIPEFTWENGAQRYDETNMKQRVVRLVNETEGGDLFAFGSQLQSTAYSGFRWYDSEGDQSIDPKLTVTIGSLQTSPDGDPLFDSYCEVTISDQAESK